MSHYTRPVKTGIALVVAYPREGLPTIHAEGCNHTTGSRNTTKSRPVTYDAEGVYGDDWYQVAPCAANGKGRICTRYNTSDCNC